MSKSGFQPAKLHADPEIEAHSDPVARKVTER